jgi:hypothetical protein
MKDVYVIRDDWDQNTICCVLADNGEAALAFAIEHFASEIEGDAYVAFIGKLNEV